MLTSFFDFGDKKRPSTFRIVRPVNGQFSVLNCIIYDGKLVNLYWEGVNSVVYDFSEGFCVAGSDTAAFLENTLNQLGLTRKEANEFIVYWLPLMKENPYNLIAFQSDSYTQAAQLSIEPAPDTLLRVFMAWMPLESAVDISTQNLTAPVRTGFTAVEWGGCQVR